MSNEQSTFAAFPQALQDHLATATQTPAQQARNQFKRKSMQPMAMPAPEGRPVPHHAPVPVIPVGFTNPSADPEAISVALPSEFAFYGFKDLYVKPFRILHLAKLSKAHEDRSMLPMIEAVSAVLSTTAQNVEGPLAFDLCVADFYFVLYWLKLHSFAKATLVTTSFCLNPVHIVQVQNKEMPEDSLKIVTTITQPNLQVNHLKELPPPELYALPEPFYCRPATMRDTVEFLEHPDWLDVEYQYLGKLASVFTSKENPRMTLAERIEVVANFDGDTCFKLQEYEKAMDCFGVEETINIKCNGCGASRDSKITLDAHSFLSAER